MPQLIAMIIIVVGAMIYMFQTFGGTGDKIEGIAQKSSVITEINNIKNGLQLALRSEAIDLNAADDDKGTNNIAKSLKGIAALEYFPEQINNQLKDIIAADKNVYRAISFGGPANNTMEITLVLPTVATANSRPGLFVDFSKGRLSTNAGFLEKQLVSDLGSLASIDIHAETPAYNALNAEGNIDKPITQSVTEGALKTDEDGKFMIYFKDLPKGMIKLKL